MLQIENLSKTYRLNDRDIEVLKNISFTAQPGEILGIVGKSGGGKSTLMKILRGMESLIPASSPWTELPSPQTPAMRR